MLKNTNTTNPIYASYTALNGQNVIEALNDTARITQQALTPAQQAQIRKNLGGGDSAIWPIALGGTGADTAEGAREALGIGVTTSISLFVPGENATGYWATKIYGACISHIFNTRAACAMTANVWTRIGVLDKSVCPPYFVQTASAVGFYALYPGGEAFVCPRNAINADAWLYGSFAYIK